MRSIDWSSDVCSSGRRGAPLCVEAPAKPRPMPQTATPSKTEETTRSPLRTVQILHALALNPAGVSLPDLSVRLELPKTSLFRLLKNLEAAGYAAADNAAYTLGTAPLQPVAAHLTHPRVPNWPLTSTHHV